MDVNVDRTLAALAEPTRRRVVDLLAERPLAAGELAGALAMTPPAMSRHLRVLRATGVVEAAVDEADTRRRVYHLRRAPFAALQAWLDQVDAFWGEQLEAFAAHVEERGREQHR